MELSGSPLFIIDVNFTDDGSTLNIFCDLFEDGGQSSAGATPICVEIDKDNPLFNLGLELIITKMFNKIGHNTPLKFLFF